MSETYDGAVIASTEVDAQGEQVDKGFLEDLLLAMGERMPINQKHDQGAPTIGSMSNFRLDERGGHWFLLADLCFDGPPPQIGGMSYTATVATNDGGGGDFRVFLPYAMYKSDGQLLAKISDEESVTTWASREKVDTLVTPQERH